MQAYLLHALRRGRYEGLAEGKAEGLVEGLAKGEAKGKAEEQRLIATSLKRQEIAIEVIAGCTHLSIKEIELL